MKTVFKSKIAFALVLAGLLFSCKKNDTIGPSTYGADTTQTTVDSIGTPDTIGMDETPSVDTIQKKNNSPIKKDSIAKKKTK